MNKTISSASYSYKYFLLILLFLCLVFSPLFAQDTPAKPFENYNVVLVFIDTLRADHLSCYGYFRKTSPNIDKLAKESFVFKENFSTAPYTFSSFMSIITSLYPDSHGVLEIYKDKLSPRVNTLAQILKTYGYKTAWFGPQHDPHLDPEAGYGRGFDIFSDAGPSNVPAEQRAILFDWLDKNKDKKFFLNFHTYKVHAPYLPLPKYKEKFTKIKNMKGVMTDWQLIYDSSWKTLKEGLHNRELVNELIGKGLFDEFIASGLLNADNKQIEEFFYSRRKSDKLNALHNYAYWNGIHLEDPAVNTYVQALYDADILEYDEEVIGHVIDKLKGLNLYDKTIIIICADHGEEFYEHKYHTHGSTLYDEVTHVPFIIRVPWMKHGRTINDLVQTVDILPTLLDLLGIPLPHQTQGKSLVNLMNNKRADLPHEYVFAKRFTDVFSIRSKEWLLVSYGIDPSLTELYHLTSDPKEQLNVYSKYKEIALKLGSELKQWKASLPSYKDKEYPFAPEIDKATQERIRKTGYW